MNEIVQTALRGLVRQKLGKDDLTQGAFARLVGVPPSRLSVWLAGKGSLGADNVAKLLKHFGLEVAIELRFLPPRAKDKPNRKE
jgi:plasmid maintenance system antidote protein VapI